MSYIVEIIFEYLQLSETLLRRLQTLTGEANLMQAWRCGRLTKSGRFLDVYYEFHGGGIYISGKEGEVEIDFCPDGQFYGFDSWRLWQFIKSSNKYVGFRGEAAVKLALEEGRGKGFLIKIPHTNLYKLSGERGL